MDLRLEQVKTAMNFSASSSTDHTQDTSKESPIVQVEAAHLDIRPRYCIRYASLFQRGGDKGVHTDNTLVSSIS